MSLLSRLLAYVAGTSPKLIGAYASLVDIAILACGAAVDSCYVAGTSLRSIGIYTLLVDIAILAP